MKPYFLRVPEVLVEVLFLVSELALPVDFEEPEFTVALLEVSPADLVLTVLTEELVFVDCLAGDVIVCDRLTVFVFDLAGLVLLAG